MRLFVKCAFFLINDKYLYNVFTKSLHPGVKMTSHGLRSGNRILAGTV